MLDRQRLPSLVSIRAFEAAARLGSFARAAQELGTTSASVSYHVRRLEVELGLPLFVRHPHKVELTDAGARIAEDTLKAFAGLRATFARAGEADERRLSITALPTFGTSWLAPRLGRFRRLHPEITLELELSAVAHDLGSGHFDAAVRNGYGDWTGLQSLKLLPSVFMPLCAPALKDAAHDLADPDATLEVPLLGRPDWWSLWYRSLGVAQAPPIERFGTHLSAEHLDAAAALAGHGITIGSPILLRDEITAGRLVPAHDAVAADGRSFWFVFPTGRHGRAKILRFRDWLAEEAARDLDAVRDLLARVVVVPEAPDRLGVAR